MKNWIRRILSKTGRFFWSWGFLKFLLIAITLIILLYVEEDWRGARAWAATKAEWEARGISFDPNSYIPPLVPDSQNLAAMPLFKLVPDPENENTPIPAALEKNLHQDPNHHNDPNHPDQPLYSPVLEYDWTEAGSPHFDKLDHDIAAYYTQIFGVPPVSNDPLVQFDAIYPFITELNSGAATRPFFRLAEDYASEPSQDFLWLSTSQIRIAKELEIHAMLALHEGRAEVALTDIRTMVTLSTGMSREPTLVSGLVSIGLCSITTTVVNYGLFVHAWNDTQLAEIQAAYGTLDLLTDCQHVLRGEFVVCSLPQFEFYKKQGLVTKNFVRPLLSHSPDSDGPVFSMWPNGWVNQNLSLAANGMFGAADQVDPKAHRIFVDPAERAAKQWEGLWMKFAPWSILYAITAPVVLNAQRQFSHGQMWIDEVRIACALERYRLAHGAYPGSLDALVPTCIDALPCDPINGQAYHYRIRSDGTFLLYSVDWNQKDDGGTSSLSLLRSAKPGDSSPGNGDWVWPTAKK